MPCPPPPPPPHTHTHLDPETPSSLQRYSALFALRNKGGREAVEALGDVFGARSALLKHEVAYVLGQMQVGGGGEVHCACVPVRAHASCLCLSMPTHTCVCVSV